jgi:hypothetical protein
VSNQGSWLWTLVKNFGFAFIDPTTTIHLRVPFVRGPHSRAGMDVLWFASKEM